MPQENKLEMKSAVKFIKEILPDGYSNDVDYGSHEIRKAILLLAEMIDSIWTQE